MRAFLVRWAIVAWVTLWPLALSAQEATLLADSVEVDLSGTIEAKGNVEVWFEQTKLSASSIRYDDAKGELTIDGPIVLTEPSQNAVLVADAAQLNSDLRNGILRSARLILNNRVQLAAASIERIDGRYLRLEKTVATSCQICAKNPVPLWQIRSDEVVQDNQRERLFFYRSWLDVAGVPILYLPRISVPNPGVTRATGFLTPRFSQASAGAGRLQVPYFIVLSDHADLTVTPEFSNGQTALDFLYRRALRQGQINLSGALDYALAPNSLTASFGYSGNFTFKNKSKLSFGQTFESRSVDLATGQLSGAHDRISNLRLSRFGEKSYYNVRFDDRISVSTYQSGYATEVPTTFLNARYGLDLGHGIRLDGESHVNFRRSTTDMVGRDEVASHLRASWRHQNILPFGILLGTQAGLTLGFNHYEDESTLAQTLTYAQPDAGLTLRWPLIAQTKNGAFQLEPVAKLGYSRRIGPTPINQDALLNELDFGNLLANDTLAGNDLSENGFHGAIGMRGSTSLQNGALLGFALGQQFRDVARFDLAPTSGHGSQKSDLVVAAQIAALNGMSLSHNAIWPTRSRISRHETRATLRRDKSTTSVAHAFLPADPVENRSSDLSILNIKSGVELSQYWQADLDLTFDLNATTSNKAKLEATYENECVKVDLSLSHSFAGSGNVWPDVGLEVELTGFGPSSKKFKRSCR